jgi:hypothetical protein
MTDQTATALAAMRSIRASPGFASLAPGEQRAFDRDLRRIEDALASSDPYALPLETPEDLQRQLGGQMPGQQTRASNGGTPAQAPLAPAQQQPSTPSPPAAPPGTADIGNRARRALDAVDFPAFVAGLITGTFQSIVESTRTQVREYADLVASISKSVDQFADEAVTPNQTRDWFVQRYPRDLQVILPDPGKESVQQPRLVPRAGRGTDPPAWLDRYGLGGQDFTEELTDGPLLEAGRSSLAEERMQTLATMVLLGINRIVVSDGQIKAKLQFHATANETVSAQINQLGAQQSGIAGRSDVQQGVATMVSTVAVNAQADAAIKAQLTGEVSIQFKTETFPLASFADTQAIQLINRHARWKGESTGTASAASTASAPASAPVPAAPAPALAPAPAPAPPPAPAPATTTAPGGRA